jgi:preprotein translocase subunit SecG
MQTLLLAIELAVAILLTVFILLQKSEGGALGIGGGGGGGGGGFGGLFSPRGASDTLTRTTTILAIMFFAVCLALNLLVAHAHPKQSPLDSRVPATQANVPAPRPAAPPPSQPVPTVPNPH